MDFCENLFTAGYSSQLGLAKQIRVSCWPWMKLVAYAKLKEELLS